MPLRTGGGPQSNARSKKERAETAGIVPVGADTARDGKTNDRDPHVPEPGCPPAVLDRQSPPARRAHWRVGVALLPNAGREQRPDAELMARQFVDPRVGNRREAEKLSRKRRLD